MTAVVIAPGILAQVKSASARGSAREYPAMGESLA